MSNYLQSGQVKVYPTAYRGSGIDPESFLNTERNIVKGSNNVAYKHRNYAYVEDDGSYTIVLGGYTFYAISSTSLHQTLASYDIGDVWVGCRIANMGSSPSPVVPTLVGESGAQLLDNGDSEEDSEFVGLAFATTEEGLSACTHKLHFLTISENTESTFVATIPLKSRLVIDSSQVSDIGTSDPINVKFTTSSIYANTASISSVQAGYVSAGSIYGDSIYGDGVFTSSLHVMAIYPLSGEDIHLVGSIIPHGSLNLGALATSSRFSNIYGVNIIANNANVGQLSATYITAPSIHGSLSGNARVDTIYADGSFINLYGASSDFAVRVGKQYISGGVTKSIYASIKPNSAITYASSTYDLYLPESKGTLARNWLWHKSYISGVEGSFTYATDTFDVVYGAKMLYDYSTTEGSVTPATCGNSYTPVYLSNGILQECAGLTAHTNIKSNLVGNVAAEIGDVPRSVFNEDIFVTMLRVSNVFKFSFKCKKPTSYNGHASIYINKYYLLSKFSLTSINSSIKWDYATFTAIKHASSGEVTTHIDSDWLSVSLRGLSSAYDEGWSAELTVVV